MNIGFLLLFLSLSAAVVRADYLDDISVLDTFRILAVLPRIQTKVIASLPQLSLTLSNDAISGSPCLAELKRALNEFLHEHSVFNLLSNSGKGINELGDYKGCKKAHGRYFVFSASVVKLGLCAPHSCRQKDFDVLKLWLVSIAQKYMKDLPVDLSEMGFVDVDKANKQEVTKGVYISFGIVILCAVAGIVASFADTLIPRTAWNSRSRKVLESFNMYKNAKTLFFAENRVDPNLDILNGIKTLFMGWIVFGHILMMLTTAPMVNIADLQNLFLNERKYAFYSSASLGVDVFFCLTGFLGVLVVTEQLKGPWKKRLLAVPLIYVHRYLRMLPVYIMAILVPLYILPYLNKGAIYFTVNSMKGDCADKWYYNLLYINNFSEESDCGGWTWYLANDFQMYFLVPPFVLLHQFRPFLAYLGTFVLMLASFGAQLWTCIHYHFTYNFSKSAQGEGNGYNKYYTRPYCRINPFLIGMLAAWMYISYRTKQKAREKAASQAKAELAVNPSVSSSPEPAVEPKRSLFDMMNIAILESWIVRYTLYVAGFLMMFACVYFFFDFYKAGTTLDDKDNYIYVLLSRPAFVVGMLFCVYPACLGKARVLRPILGMELFNVLSRVVFSAYMFNMLIIAFYHGSREDGLYFNTQSIWMMALEIFVLTYVNAVFTTLLFEYPVIGLSKEFLRPKRQNVISRGESSVKTAK